MDVLLAFGAALLALRLAGRLLRRGRALWAAALGAYAVAAAALAWSAAAGWSGASFRVYYLCGALLTAPLLGAGSLELAGRRVARPLACAWAGLAAGIVLAVPVHGAFGGAIPPAQDHLDLFPARAAAIAGNSLGTLAVVAVALLGFRRRPLGNALILAGVAAAAIGSALTGLGVAATSATIALGVVLLYAGVVAPRAELRWRRPARSASPIG
jgi:hypothetical protein